MSMSASPGANVRYIPNIDKRPVCARTAFFSPRDTFIFDYKELLFPTLTLRLAGRLLLR